MNVRKEIDSYSDDADKPVLLWLFDRYHMADQWRFVASCTHQRYGTQSYQTRRIWHPTIEGAALHKALSDN